MANPVTVFHSAVRTAAYNAEMRAERDSVLAIKEAVDRALSTEWPMGTPLERITVVRERIADIFYSFYSCEVLGSDLLLIALHLREVIDMQEALQAIEEVDARVARAVETTDLGAQAFAHGTAFSVLAQGIFKARSAGLLTNEVWERTQLRERQREFLLDPTWETCRGFIEAVEATGLRSQEVDIFPHLTKPQGAEGGDEPQQSKAPLKVKFQSILQKFKRKVQGEESPKSPPPPATPPAPMTPGTQRALPRVSIQTPVRQIQAELIAPGEGLARPTPAVVETIVRSFENLTSYLRDAAVAEGLREVEQLMLPTMSDEPIVRAVALRSERTWVEWTAALGLLASLGLVAVRSGDLARLAGLLPNPEAHVWLGAATQTLSALPTPLFYSVVGIGDALLCWRTVQVGRRAAKASEEAALARVVSLQLEVMRETGSALTQDQLQARLEEFPVWMRAHVDREVLQSFSVTYEEPEEAKLEVVLPPFTPRSPGPSPAPVTPIGPALVEGPPEQGLGSPKPQQRPESDALSTPAPPPPPPERQAPPAPPQVLLHPTPRFSTRKVGARVPVLTRQTTTSMHDWRTLAAPSRRLLEELKAKQAEITGGDPVRVLDLGKGDDA